MTGLYFVIIYKGSRHPDYVRSHGAFSSFALANRWCKREGLEQTPGEGEWATIIPRPELTGEGPGWSGVAPPVPPSSAPEPLSRVGERAICPVCREGEPTRMGGTPGGMYSPPPCSASLTTPRNAWGTACRWEPPSVRVASTSACFCRPRAGPSASAPRKPRRRMVGIKRFLRVLQGPMVVDPNEAGRRS
jgi:hypothetical protein